jgi:TIR domain-containing protein
MRGSEVQTPQVFISYSHSETDKEWVRQFAQSLERRGFSVWLDETRLHFGDRIREAVEEGLRNSDVIVSLVTPQSVNRPNLFFELGAALGMGKRVIAIVPKDLDLALLPQPLRARRFLQQASPEETASALAAETASAPAEDANGI